MGSKPECPGNPSERVHRCNEPDCEPVENEVSGFEAAFRNRSLVLFKGPTGCGKTRLMEYEAWRLARPLPHCFLSLRPHRFGSGRPIFGA